MKDSRACPPDRNAVLGCALDTPAGLLNLFVTHWAIDLLPDSPQVPATVQIVQSWRAGAPVILPDDFNALPDSGSMARLGAVLDDAFAVIGVPNNQRISYPSGAYGSTNPEGWSGALDYIFVSSAITVERSAVVHDEAQASDHNLVVVHIRI